MHRTALLRPILILSLLLSLAGCKKALKSVVRRYAGHIYAQYYDKQEGESGEYRYLTLLWDGDKWVAGVPHQLANDVQARGQVVDQSDSPPSVPSLDGSGSRAAAFMPTSTLYTLDVYGQDRIVVSDLDAGAILTTVNLPRLGSVSIASSAASPFIYVSNQAQSAVGTLPATPAGITVFDKRTNTIAMDRVLPDGIVPFLGQNPLGLALSPDGSRLYLVNNGPPATIEVYDAATLSSVASIAAGGSTFFEEAVVSPDGSLLCAVRSDGRIALIDTLTSTVSTLIPMGGSPTSPIFSPDGTIVYFARRTDIAIVDAVTATLSSTRPIPGAVRVAQVLLSTDGEDLFANDAQGGQLVRFDTATLQIVQTLPSSPGSVIFGPE